MALLKYYGDIRDSVPRSVLGKILFVYILDTDTDTRRF